MASPCCPWPPIWRDLKRISSTRCGGGAIARLPPRAARDAHASLPTAIAAPAPVAQWKHFVDTLSNIETYEQSLEEFAAGYKKFGFSKKADGTIVFREWCPPAAEAWLVGEFNDWKGEPMTRDQFGVWSCELPPGAIPHDSLVKIRIRHHDGWTVDRFPGAEPLDWLF